MKITREALKSLIAEEFHKNESILLEMPIGSTTGTKMGAQDGTAGYPKDPDGEEGSDARSRLFHISAQAQQLHDVLMDDENLEPWVQDKITKASDYIEAVFKDLMYKKNNPEGR